MPFLNSESKLKFSPSSSHSHRVEVHHHKDHDNVFHAFNKHARDCSQCAKPLEVARRGEMLCDQGHQMAIEIAKVLYDIAGRRAEEYRTTSGWLGILVDFTKFNGPIFELVQAMDYGLRERKPPTIQPAVFSASIRSKPVSRHSTSHEHRDSSRHHHHYHHTPYYDPHTLAVPRYDDRVVVHHHSSESERSPRASGSLRVHVPLADGRERQYYEEVYHPNGGKVTTKYYHVQPPRLQRSNTIGPEGSTRTVSTGKSGGSKVRFNEEVKYYP